MTGDSRPAIQVVPITQIETEDGTFATTPGWIVNEALRRSIERIGLTTPLLLQRHTGSRLRIVCGFQRQRLAASVGLKTVPALVTEERDRRKLFDLAPNARLFIHFFDALHVEGLFTEPKRYKREVLFFLNAAGAVR